MNGALSNPRYERKFVVRQMPANAVRSAIMRHAALFREVYPPRSINNVDFDTPGLSDYADHLRGAAARTKTRVRWYGEAGVATRPVLERKSRRGELGGKESFPLPPWCIDGGDAWPGLADALSRATLPDGVREAVPSAPRSCSTATIATTWPVPTGGFASPWTRTSGSPGPLPWRRRH